MGQTTYHLRNIRKLLTTAFTDEELRQLCYDEPQLRPVYEQFSMGMSKDQIVQRLIEYCERKGLLGKLLAVVEEETPVKYQEFADKLGTASAEAASSSAAPHLALTQTKELLEMKMRHLHSLQMKKAAYGLLTPPHIEIEIEDLEVEIAELKQKLNA
jgi:replicative DNA helicase